MESTLYACSRYKKGVTSPNGLIRYVNAHKIPVTLPSCQPFTPTPILEYNTTYYSNLPLDYFEKDISLGLSNNDKEEIRLVDTMGNVDENSRPVDIDKQKSTTTNWMPQNGRLSELS